MRRISTWETSDGTHFLSKRKAALHESKLKRRAARARREASKGDVYRLRDGRWSIRCQNCGSRHTMRFSDDFVWCPECRADCAAHGHEPDDDDPSSCFPCGATIDRPSGQPASRPAPASAGQEKTK